ncbi:MAG: hypothetical protein KAI24_02605 [Planctomycetes bacterium]|nr:hypothetical protein [Planctomycetota bacterium]
MPASDLAAFFLPGLVHQFGNLLLTVQGHVLHVEPDGIPRMRDAVLGAVQRGSASLHVARVLLGERIGAPGDAADLTENLIELGRIPARERGVGLEVRGALPGGFWVDAETFVTVGADAIRRLVLSVPPGSSGVVVVTASDAGDGRLTLRVTFEPGAGSLPFPLAFGDVRDGLQARLRTADGDARITTDEHGVGLSFAMASVSPAFEA